MLCMTGLCLLFLSACRKEAEPVSPPPASPLIAAQVEREAIAAKMQAALEKMRDRLGEVDAATLKAALAKDAEWVRLEREFADKSKSVESLRAAEKKAISK